MKCVERSEYGWCADNFYAFNPTLSNFFLKQSQSFCVDANMLLRQVDGISEDSTEDEINNILYSLASYNDYGLSVCKALNELYEPLVAEYMMLANDTSERCVLDGNNVFEPLYKTAAATKQQRLIAVILYQLNIQTNVSYIEHVLNYIVPRIESRYFDEVDNG